ncbi:MAG: curli production assembly/transport protein CsgE [Bacteroidetes bacterium]|nr:curli production assembly/transport protein CsgE [Bacteroidota bacterium]
MSRIKVGSLILFIFFNCSMIFAAKSESHLNINAIFSSLFYLVVKCKEYKADVIHGLQTKDSLKMFAIDESNNASGISNLVLLYDYNFSKYYYTNIHENLVPDLLTHEQNLQTSLPNKKSEIFNDSSKVQKNNQSKINIISDSSFNKRDCSIRNDVEIESIIVDQTQSKLGKDFFDLFNYNWNPPKNNNSFTIVIEEKVLPRLGTLVVIEIDGNDIYQKLIQPRYESIEESAIEGVNIALVYLENYEEIQKELQGKDLKGTGIF